MSTNTMQAVQRHLEKREDSINVVGKYPGIDTNSYEYVGPTCMHNLQSNTTTVLHTQYMRKKL